MPSNILETIDRLKQQLDALRPLPPEVTGRVEQKLRIESNYHSNALEGNTLTLAETRSLLLHGLTARGKPMREHLDIEGYDRAIKELARMAREDHPLSESFICNLHRVLLNEPYEVETIAADGRNTRRAIAVGAYKSTANNIVTSTGETYYFTPPEQVRHAMRELIDWYQAQEKEGEHPIISAAIFHYRFVRIHPFDDGNGRMARLLMNRILLQHGYPLAIVRRDTRARYLQELERADQTEDPGRFIEYIASCCEYPLNLYLRAARGEPIEDTDDIDREIALFRHRSSKVPKRKITWTCGVTWPKWCCRSIPTAGRNSERLPPNYSAQVRIRCRSSQAGTRTGGTFASLASLQPTEFRNEHRI